MKRKDDYRRVLGEFRAGKIDILIGTQMIAKGLHFPNVTLVGIIYRGHGAASCRISARANAPFNCSRRWRAAPGAATSRARCLCRRSRRFIPPSNTPGGMTFVGFYEQEIEFREQLKYPPAGRAALLTLKGRNEDKVKFSAEHVKREVEARALAAKPEPAADERPRKRRAGFQI